MVKEFYFATSITGLNRPNTGGMVAAVVVAVVAAAPAEAVVTIKYQHTSVKHNYLLTPPPQ
jgi:hypothetical protein